MDGCQKTLKKKKSVSEFGWFREWTVIETLQKKKKKKSESTVYLSLVTEMRAFGILTNCECQHIIQGRESATIMPALHPPEHSRFNCCSLSASIQPAALQILAQLNHSHLHPVLSISSTLKPMHLSGQGKVKIGRSCGSKIHHDVYIPETFLSIS